MKKLYQFLTAIFIFSWLLLPQASTQAIGESCTSFHDCPPSNMCVSASTFGGKKCYPKIGGGCNTTADCGRIEKQLDIVGAFCNINKAVDGYPGSCDVNTDSNYTCSWRKEITTTNPEISTSNTTGGCYSNEGPGSDCDPAQKPSNNSGFAHSTKVFCCCPGQTIAATKKADFIIPILSTNIDTVKLSQEVNCTGEDGSGECQIPWIAEYINGVYQYGFGIGGILAAIMLMAGGLMWLVSAGDASKITQAKDLILGSIVGLMILSTSYLILTMINPDLINMKPLKIGQIKKLEPIIDGSDSNSNAADTCINEAELKNISNLVTTSAQTPSLSSDAYIGLEKAIEEAKKQGVELYITSAFRTDAHQQQLWEDALAKHGDPDTAARYVARPGSCGGHRNGSAIDVCIKSGSSCGKINADNAEASDSDILKLQDIMKKAGWLRYCGEWWHFQYNDTPKKSCSP